MAASVAAVVGGSLPAHATWQGPAIATTNIIAQGVDAAKENIPAAADAPYLLGVGESLTDNDLITITLTGNATFGEDAPQLSCNGGGDLGGGPNNFATPLSGGGEGSTSASWRAINDQCDTGDTLVFNSGTGPFNVTAVGAGDEVDFLLSLETSTGLPIGSPNHSFANESTGSAAAVYPFEGENLFALGGTPGVSENNIAQVQTSYTLFGAAAASTTTTNTASIDLDLNNGAAVPSADLDPNELLFTVAGDLNGIAMIEASGVESEAGEADGEFSIDVEEGEATASNDATIFAGTGFGFADLQATIDGETTQAARTLTLLIELDGDDNYSAHTVYGPAPAIVIGRNGTFFTTNSTGPANRIKITDTSGSSSVSGGEINVDCFDAAGMMVEPVETVELPEKVESDATVIVEGADLTAYCPGAVRFDFTVNTEEAAISNVKRTAEGSDLTVYGNGNGGNL
jgi:hypothetical protein